MMQFVITFKTNQYLVKANSLEQLTELVCEKLNTKTQHNFTSSTLKLEAFHPILNIHYLLEDFPEEPAVLRASYKYEPHDK